MKRRLLVILVLTIALSVATVYATDTLMSANPTGKCGASLIPDYGISAVVVTCVLAPGNGAGFGVKYWSGDLRGPINATATVFSKTGVVTSAMASCGAFNCDGGIGGFVSLIGGNLLVVTGMTANSTSQVQLKY